MTISIDRLTQNLSISLKKESDELLEGVSLYLTFALPYAVAIVTLKGLSDEALHHQGLTAIIVSPLLEYSCYGLALYAFAHLQKELNDPNSTYLDFFKVKHVKIPKSDLADMMKHLEFLKKK